MINVPVSGFVFVVVVVVVVFGLQLFIVWLVKPEGKLYHTFYFFLIILN